MCNTRILGASSAFDSSTGFLRVFLAYFFRLSLLIKKIFFQIIFKSNIVGLHDKLLNADNQLIIRFHSMFLIRIFMHCRLNWIML